jgi:hypothetical protein
VCQVEPISGVNRGSHFKVQLHKSTTVGSMMTYKYLMEASLVPDWRVRKRLIDTITDEPMYGYTDRWVDWTNGQTEGETNG